MQWQYGAAIFRRHLWYAPHSAATPTAHPLRVDTRKEICLTANEILLRKVKSVCDG